MKEQQKDWKTKVRAERAELAYKLYKLDEFIKFSITFVELDKVAQTQLIHQRDIMRSYKEILTQRLDT